MAGFNCQSKSNDTTPEGGVDAMLRDVPNADSPPETQPGNSKRAGIRPKDCADELEGACWAQELIKAGGSDRRRADATTPWANGEAPLVTTDVLPTLTDQSRGTRWKTGVIGR